MERGVRRNSRIYPLFEQHIVLYNCNTYHGLCYINSGAYR